MKKLNVGLVGAGFMGKAHSIGYSDMPKYFWPAPGRAGFKDNLRHRPGNRSGRERALRL